MIFYTNGSVITTENRLFTFTLYIMIKHKMEIWINCANGSVDIRDREKNKTNRIKNIVYYISIVVILYFHTHRESQQTLDVYDLGNNAMMM